MEEIKVGEYVRTKRHGICKLLECEIDGAGEWCGLVDIPIFLRKDNIIKHSPNIIDLIEVGDYVNGEKVNEILELVVLTGTEYIPIKNEDIKTILTKEQFQSAKYEVRNVKDKRY